VVQTVGGGRKGNGAVEGEEPKARTLLEAPRRLRAWVDGHPNYVIGAGAVVVALLALATSPSVAGHDEAGCRAVGPSDGTTTEPATISDPPAADVPLEILIDRDGAAENRKTAPLTVLSGVVMARGHLSVSTTDLARSDGLIMPAAQVTSWGEVNESATAVVIHVCVDPRLGGVSDPGRYLGSAYLDDPRASGGVVPLVVHIQYPYLNRVLLIALVAALGGLIWASVIHAAAAGSEPARLRPSGTSLLVVRVAAMLAAVPVVLAIVVNNRDWQGDLPQYLALTTAVGGAVIAATPTLRALASRTTPEQRRQDAEAVQEALAGDDRATS